MHNSLKFIKASKEDKLELNNNALFSLRYIPPVGDLINEWDCFILKLNTEVVAYLSTEVHQGYEDVIWIQNLCTLDKYQRKGFAKKLVVDFLNYLNSSNYRQVNLHANKEYIFNFWELNNFKKIKQEGESILYSLKL